MHSADSLESECQRFAMSESQLAEFARKGFTGPFDLLSPEDIAGLTPTFDNILGDNLKSPVYDRTTHRDWHLHYKNLLSVVYRPRVLDRLTSLLGPNLLVWRTSIFHKAPGDGALAWHQSSLFAGEEYGIFKPALAPPPQYEVYTDLFNVSVWVALDDVIAENGAMQVSPGTHMKQFPVKKVPFDQSVFAKVARDNFERSGDLARMEQLSKRFACETIFDPEDQPYPVETIEMKRGQFFIFTDRVMHSSTANVTLDKRRLAMNFRITIPEVIVYPHRLWGDMVDGNDHDVSEHACVMLAGEDRTGKNLYLN